MSNKGRQLDASMFFVDERASLPSMSTGEERPAFGRGRGGHDRDERRRDDEEMEVSRADEDSQWRRGPREQPVRQQSRLTTGNADEDSQWRRGDDRRSRAARTHARAFAPTAPGRSLVDVMIMMNAPTRSRSPTAACARRGRGSVTRRRTRSSARSPTCTARWSTSRSVVPVMRHDAAWRNAMSCRMSHVVAEPGGGFPPPGRWSL